MSAPQAIGPVRYARRAPRSRASATPSRASLTRSRARFVESFMTAPSPGIVACAMQNAHYPDLTEYVAALADALRIEYEAIVGARVRPADRRARTSRWSATRCSPTGRSTSSSPSSTRVVAAINRALANVRATACACTSAGATTRGRTRSTSPLDDAPAAPLPRARRRAHAVDGQPAPRARAPLLARHPLPRDWLLIAGVIDTTTNYVEHPEVVADRIERAAARVGDPRRVLAGTDCGFDTSAGLGDVAEEVVWEKLRALRAGADLATQAAALSSQTLREVLHVLPERVVVRGPAGAAVAEVDLESLLPALAQPEDSRARAPR